MLGWLEAAVASASVAMLGLAVGAVLLLAFGVGQLLGRFRATAHARREESGVGTITAGMLGLLAFTLGLTISIAEDRFEARRHLVVEEANAIGTAWLRAQAIGGPEASAIQAMLTDYTRLRIDYTRHSANSTAAEIVQQSDAMAARIWQQMTTLIRRENTPATGLLMAALNSVFDMAAAQRFAYESHVPTTILRLLLAGSILSIGAMGYQMGLSRRLHLVLSTLLISMWAGGMVLIADLSRPRDGHIRPDPAPLLWTLQGFGSGAANQGR